MSVRELTLVNGQPRSAKVVADSVVEQLEIEFKNIPDDIEGVFIKNLALVLSMDIAKKNQGIQHLLN